MYQDHSLRQEHGDAHQYIPQIPIPTCITTLGLEHRTQSFQSKCYLPRPHELTIKKGSTRSCHTSKRVLQVHIDEFKSHQSASKLIKNLLQLEFSLAVYAPNKLASQWLGWLKMMPLARTKNHMGIEFYST